MVVVCSSDCGHLPPAGPVLGVKRIEQGLLEKGSSKTSTPRAWGIELTCFSYPGHSGDCRESLVESERELGDQQGKLH